MKRALIDFCIDAFSGDVEKNPLAHDLGALFSVKPTFVVESHGDQRTVKMASIEISSRPRIALAP